MTNPAIVAMGLRKSYGDTETNARRPGLPVFGWQTWSFHLVDPQRDLLGPGIGEHVLPRA